MYFGSTAKNCIRSIVNTWATGSGFCPRKRRSNEKMGGDTVAEDEDDDDCESDDDEIKV